MENNKRIVNYILIFFFIFSIIVFALFIILSRQAKKTGKNSAVVSPSPYFFNPSKSRISNTNKSGLPLSPSPSPLMIPTNTALPISFTGVKEEPFDPQSAKKTDQIFNLIKNTPVILDNLKINYDFKSENFVVSPQSGSFIFTEEERKKVYQWFEENYPDIPKEEIIFSSTPYVSPTPIPRPETVSPIYLSPEPISTSSANNEMQRSFKTMIEILKVISDIASINEQSGSPSNNNQVPPANNYQISPTPIAPKQTTITPVSYQPPQNQYSYVYYPQCGGPFDNYLLPGEKNQKTGQPCNICYAGCGPTTVAMIVASYKDRSIDPRQIVNEYGPAVGCGGSGYTTAQQVLRKYNIKVGELFLSNKQGVRADEIASIFKEYINTGKTIFVLANFPAGGHFFWVIDVDKNNNIWSFDPAYGTRQIPYNQNSRYPFPLYRVAFTVSP
jgi:hypothetical protein